MVAEHCRQKLIRRHPHIFGDVEAEQAAEVLRNWDAIKRDEPGREPGIFGEVPENLPGPLYARKVQRRAASTGFDFDHVPYEGVTVVAFPAESRTQPPMPQPAGAGSMGTPLLGIGALGLAGAAWVGYWTHRLDVRRRAA